MSLDRSYTVGGGNSCKKKYCKVTSNWFKTHKRKV